MVIKKLIKLYIKWRVEDFDRIINDNYGLDGRWHDGLMLIPDILMFSFILDYIRKWL